MIPSSASEPQSSKFKPLIDQCRDIALVYTSVQLAEFFEQTDTALMDFADKAESNQLQMRFIESMPIVRAQRPDIEINFREQIVAAFNSFGGSPKKALFGSNNPASSGYNVEELSLVAEEDMDETVALGNMVSRTESDNFENLYALGQRFAILNRGQKIPVEVLPVGPQKLIDAFKSALVPLDLESQVRLVLFALFDKVLLKKADDLYDELNTSLIAAGVLPHLKPMVNPSARGQTKRKKAKAEPTPDSNTSAADNQAALGEELFGSILELMATKRSNTGQTYQEPLNPVSQETLISTINQLNPPTPAQYPDAISEPLLPDIEIDQAFLQNVKITLTADRDKIVEEVGRDNLSSADADTIDLVGMLFEYMLNDPVLPNVAKALISHLHTPYLKIAIIDKRLLADNLHPARQLLDIMVEAGGYWVDESDLKRGVFAHMQTVIDRVLKEFINDVSLFDDLLEWFRGKIEDHKQNSGIIEQRSQESAQGRETLDIAKQRSTQEIKARTSQWLLPKSVETFLTETWIDKLIFILLRNPEGEFSDDWNDALRVADELVWAFDPNISKTDQAEFKTNLPTLKQTIEDGLESLGGFPHAKVKQLFRVLESPNEADQTESAEPTAPSIAQDETETTEVGIPLETDELPEEDVISHAEQELMERLHSYGPNSWFDLSLPGKEKPQRLKLSWLSAETSTCLFVDKQGVQAAILPLLDLSRDILAGKTKIVKRAKKPFMERTMLAIRNMLTRTSEQDNQEKEGNTS